MIVVSLTDCPPKVRGDLSKWLMEINTGVYVGNLSARVRDELWSRLCENLPSGRATMVFNTSGEQHMDFRVHNTTWEAVDFDGIKLMRRPSPKRLSEKRESSQTPQVSRAAAMEKVRNINAARQKKATSADYSVIDLETSGTTTTDSEIIEFGALRIRSGQPTAELSILVRAVAALPGAVCELTGITDELLSEQGIPLSEALAEFLEFVGEDRLVSHNAAFDFSFLRLACKQCGMEPPKNQFTDTLPLARRKVNGVDNYKLVTLAEHFSIDTPISHRALADCYTAYAVYAKLNEI